MKHIRITEAEFAALLGAFTEDRSRRLEEAEARLNKDALIEACLAGVTEYEPLYD